MTPRTAGTTKRTSSRARIEKVGGLTKLPGTTAVYLDTDTIIGARIENSVVIVHTNEGFAVGLTPGEDQTAREVLDQLLELLAAG